MMVLRKNPPQKVERPHPPFVDLLEGPAPGRPGPREERPMTRYMLSVCYEAEATMPPPEELAAIGRAVDVVHADLQAEGAWVFGGGLHDASTATVVRVRGGEVLTTDGPFVETKEQLGGFSVVDVADLDEALRWAERLAAATTCPIEVRPFQHDSTA